MSLEKSNLPSSSAELLEEIDVLIKRDQMLTIWNKIQEVKPLTQWDCGEPRRMAAIISYRLGNRRQADMLDYLNYRSDRNHPKWALYYQFRRVVHATQPVVIKSIDAILAGTVSAITSMEDNTDNRIKIIVPPIILPGW